MRRLFLTLLATFAAGPALAWGPEGHAIVAEIAEARLTPTAQAQVAALLRTEGHEHLDEIASWADAYRESHPETGPWHFVDIPLDDTGYDPARDCAGGNCVVVQIQRFAAVLRDAKAPVADRVQALKFVVHFVGDIHQPLHCENNNDRGGNDMHLTYLGRQTNLRAVWDGGMIEAALNIGLGSHYRPDLELTRTTAEILDSLVEPETAKGWVPAGSTTHLDFATKVWADDSHRIAKQAYGDLPARHAGGWDDAYQEAEWPVVETQLAKAGVRLAALLNEEFD